MVLIPDFKTGILFRDVNSDDRRRVFVNNGLLKDKEISIIELKKGKAIGGCLHNNREYYVILAGTVEVHKKNKPIVLEIEGCTGTFNPKEAHMFRAYEDSIIMEYGLTTEEKLKDKKDEEMRKEMENINLEK